MDIVVSESAIQKARLSGLLFYWQIEFTDGKTLSQFTEDGSEPPAVLMADKEHLVKKSENDPYPYSMVFRDVRRAVWIPAYPELPIYGIDLKPTEQLVLYKKNYIGISAGSGSQSKYTVYCIGSRNEPMHGDPVENVAYICPPHQEALAGDADSSLGFFSGAVVESTDPNFQNPYDTYLRSRGKKNLTDDHDFNRA